MFKLSLKNNEVATSSMVLSKGREESLNELKRRGFKAFLLENLRERLIKDGI